MPRARIPATAAGLAGAAVAGVATAGCLPGDIRPEPAAVHATAEPGAETSAGFVTQDGWSVVFERLLVGLGSVAIEGDACNAYSQARYRRLYDFVVPGRQKTSDLYGLGSCDVRFRIRTLDADDLLAAGTTPADLAFMRTPGTDAYVTGGGASVHVRGRAARGAVTKRFEWTFRRAYEMRECPAEPGAPLATALRLRGGETVDFPIVVRGEELLRGWASDSAPLRFDAIAAADADGDGAVALEELAKQPPPVEPADGGAEAGPAGDGGADAAADAGDGGGPTLAGYVYEKLVPRMAHAGGGAACKGEMRGGGR